MFSMCSELTLRARIPDTRIPQLKQPWFAHKAKLSFRLCAQGLIDILKLKFRQDFTTWSLVSILLLMFCRDYEVESWSRF